MVFKWFYPFSCYGIFHFPVVSANVPGQMMLFVVVVVVVVNEGVKLFLILDFDKLCHLNSLFSQLP